MYLNVCQIFYPYNKFDTEEKMKELTQYMYRPHSEPIVAPEPRETPEPTPAPTPTPRPAPTPKTVSPLFFPNKQNSMFWCLYIFVHGYDEFLTIQKSKQSTIELSENQKIIDSIRSNVSLLKTTNHKITNAKCQEILSDLMVGGNNNISLLLAYSVFYKLSIVVFTEGTLYLEMKPEDGSGKQIFMYYDSAEKKYGINLSETDHETGCALKEKCLYVENANKPLKAVSHYKLGDLQKMATLLTIDTPPKQTKSELYVALEHKFLVLLKDWAV
jgi:hypothetical protein